MFFDFHCHISALFQHMIAAQTGIDGIHICVSCKNESEVDRALGYASQYPEIVKLSAGIHPTEQSDYNFLSRIERLCDEEKVSAIGECGFDFCHDPSRTHADYQANLFSSQLELAIRYHLPVVVHCCKGMDMVFRYADLLAQCRAVLFHGWSGTVSEATYLLNHGINAIFSFGIRAVQGNRRALECLNYLPVSHIVAETDSPFQLVKDATSSWEKVLTDITGGIAKLKEVSTNDILIAQDTLWTELFKKGV